MTFPKPNFEYWREIMLLALMVAVFLFDALFLGSIAEDTRDVNMAPPLMEQAAE